VKDTFKNGEPKTETPGVELQSVQGERDENFGTQNVVKQAEKKVYDRFCDSTYVVGEHST
jgi:hypothetical protein